MPEETKPPANYTRAQQIFIDSPDDLKKLIKDVLEEERKVMHKQHRSKIHQNIYDQVKRLIR